MTESSKKIPFENNKYTNAEILKKYGNYTTAPLHTFLM